MTRTQQNYLGCLLLLLVGIAAAPFFDEDAESESRLADIKAGLAQATFPVRIGMTSELTGASVTEEKVFVFHYRESGKPAAAFTQDEKAAMARRAEAAVCDNRESVENFTAIRAYREEWRDAAGETIVDVTITPETCLKR